MLKQLAIASLVFFTFGAANAAELYPKSPEETLTPGDLCTTPSEYRYPEQIKYCERDVSTGAKKRVFVEYDQAGYRTRTLQRNKFKVDHYIPLCMGGSNSQKNLWPQHETVYSKTDELEFELCEKMKAGRLRQRDAVQYIKEAKNNLDRVEEIRRIVSGL